MDGLNVMNIEHIKTLTASARAGVETIATPDLPQEVRANLILAYRHLEDAEWRLNLAATYFPQLTRETPASGATDAREPESPKA